MSVKDGCAKIENIAEQGSTTNGAVVSEQTATTSSQQSENTAKNWMTKLDSGVNKFSDAVEEVASAMDTGTRQLNAVDCSDMLFDFLKEKVPFFGTANSLIDKGTNFMNGLSTGASIGKLIQEPDFVKNICSFIENWGGMIDGWIDIGVKAAIVLFNKIDAARERLENATLDFTEAVRHCVLDVFNAMRDKIMKTINLSISINWDDLIKHMYNCPCLCKIIANLTGCTEDDAGNDITTNPAAVKYCLEQKFSLLTPVGLSVAVDNLLTKYVKKYINLVFNYLESWIVYIYNVIMKPFRSLLKKYVNLLRKKLNVDAFIKGLGPFECLFVYTTEYDDGDKYYGMSIIDMINTYRGWIGCLQMACPALSEKIKNRTKQLYKDLRLDDKYWRRAMEADIYTCCLAVDLDGMTPRESVLRKLYGESPWDWLMSLFRKEKNKDDETSPEDEEAEEYELSRPITAADMMPNSENQGPSKISDAIKFVYAPESENDVNVGTKKISSGDENILMTVGDSMVAGSKTDQFYVERFYQLVRFGNKYATSKDYVSHMRENMDNIEKLSGNFDSNTECSIPSTTNRPPDTLNDMTGLPTVDNPDAAQPVEPTYSIPDDFDNVRTQKIAGYVFTAQYPNESLEDYYKRMYQAALYG